MKEVVELYEYAKERNEVNQLFRILHHLKEMPHDIKEQFKEDMITISILSTLQRIDENYSQLFSVILKKVSNEELRKALDILYCLDYKFDEQRIKLDFAMIYNEELKSMLIEKVSKKDKEFAEKLTKIFSIVEIEVEKEEILKVTDPEHWFKKYGGIFVEGQIENDKGKIKIMKVASNKFVVDVWDCQARILLRDREQLFSFDEKYKNYDEKIYDELCNTVIYDDNDGAINMSGQYYAKSERSVKLFEELVKSAKGVK